MVNITEPNSSLKDDSAFSTTYDVVNDLGVDDTGGSAIDSTLENNAANGVLFTFPTGEFLVANMVLNPYDNIGIKAQDQANPVVKPRDSQTNGERIFLEIAGGGDGVKMEGFEVDYSGVPDDDAPLIYVESTSGADFYVADMYHKGYIYDRGYSVQASDTSGVGLMENVRIPDGAVGADNTSGGNSAGVLVNQGSHDGKCGFRDCEINHCTEGGIYASPDTTEVGSIQVKNCTFKNNVTADIRVGAEGSGIENCTFLHKDTVQSENVTWDEDHPLRDFGGSTSRVPRSIRFRGELSGYTIPINNCTFEYDGTITYSGLDGVVDVRGDYFAGVEITDSDYTMELDEFVYNINENLSNGFLVDNVTIEGDGSDGTKVIEDVGSDDFTFKNGTIYMPNASTGIYLENVDPYTIKDSGITVNGTKIETVSSSGTQSNITDATTPSIDTFSVSEVETDNPDAEFDVSWAVSDPGDDLDTVDFTLSDTTDSETEDTQSVSVSGGSASGTARLVAVDDDTTGNEYAIDITVTDTNTETNTDTQSIIETEVKTESADFLKYVSNNLFDDFTPTWGSSESQWSTVDTDSKFEGLSIELNKSDTTSRTLEWDMISNESKFEVLALTRFVASDGNDKCRLIAPLSGDSSLKTGYFCAFYGNGSGDFSYYLGKYDDGSFDELDFGVDKPSSEYDGALVYQRFKVTETEVKAKAWLTDEPEPSTWDAEATDSSLGNGSFGIGGLSDDVQQWKYISVGVGGSTPTFPNKNQAKQLTGSNAYRIVDGVFQTVPITINPTTGDATNIGSNSADLSATLFVLEGYNQADLSIEYRQDGSSTWDNETAATTVTEGGSITESVSSLSSGTTYEYRAKATGVGEGTQTDTGRIRTFTTN